VCWTLQRDCTLQLQQTVQDAGWPELAKMPAEERAGLCHYVSKRMLKHGKKGANKDGVKARFQGNK